MLNIRFYVSYFRRLCDACGPLIHLMKTILVVQAENNITQYPLTEGWGGKHQLFIKWKHVEAKVSCLLPVTLKVLFSE